MKKIFSIVCILFCAFLLKAQKSDLKLSPFAFFGEHAKLIYEQGINSNLSFSVGLRYGEGIQLSKFHKITRVLIISPTREFHAQVEGRYYFFPKKGGDGFFTGLAIRYETFTDISYETVFEQPENRVLIPIPIGYKWIFWNRAVLELGSATTGYRDRNSRGIKTDKIVFNPFFFLHLGYRF